MASGRGWQDLLSFDVHQQVVMIKEVGADDQEADVGNDESPFVQSILHLDTHLPTSEGYYAGPVGCFHVGSWAAWVVYKASR